MCEWQRLLLQQHSTNIVMNWNISEWQSNGAIGWICVNTVSDLEAAINVHTTTIKQTTDGSRCIRLY
jgi:hypothetical protein